MVYRNSYLICYRMRARGRAWIPNFHNPDALIRGRRSVNRFVADFVTYFALGVMIYLSIAHFSFRGSVHCLKDFWGTPFSKFTHFSRPVSVVINANLISDNATGGKGDNR